MKTNVHFLSCLLRKRNVSHNICRANQNTHFMLRTIFKKSRAVYEITLKNTVEQDRPPMTIRRMRISCRMPKATDTHSQYIILIAFPLQQWLYERASVLRDAHIACLVYFNAIIANATCPSVRCHIRYNTECCGPDVTPLVAAMSPAAMVPKKEIERI